MSTQNNYWPSTATEDKKRDEQIDPSFSREGLHPIAQINQQDANQLVHASHQGESLTEDNFDVAAAAVAVSNDNASESSGEHDQKSGTESPLSRNGRALTNTKRAAQNRMAQRAFRQRKEVYIKDLEDKAKEVEKLKATIESLKQENMQLRDYSLALQAKLIEQPDVPAPPSAVVYGARTGTKKD